MTKQQIINNIIDIEGGYVDDPSDSGGETNFGITLKVARANGYHGPMVDMPRKEAFRIYSLRYWDSVRADEMPDDVAEEVVDTAVNMGVSRAGKFLQRALNALNNRGTLYPDLSVDGNVGPATIDALTKFCQLRDTSVLLAALNCLQGSFYIELAERREKDEKFVYGWLKNRVSV